MKAIIATFALGAAVVFAATAPVGAQGTGGSPGSMKGHPMMMTLCPGGYVLNAVGGSGESGCATPRGGNGVIFLAIKVTGEPAGAKQPSHIHRGKCGSNGPVALPLTPVVNGTSSTTIPMAKWRMFNHGGFYINIHESPDNIPHIVSCANITAMPMHGAM
ncbi:MAG TPA: CHRD domain-containing protein [Dongiaceae bacterium]|nr:CHRD domain-containing protein [Dongiaceae bacterium]